MDARDEETAPLLSGEDGPVRRYDDGGEDGGESSSDQTKKTVGLFTLFRYATCCDIFLIFLGSLMSIAHGFGWPALSLVFGKMTNDFISYAKQNKTLNGTGFDMQRHMTEYALYYVYIACSVFVAAYLQISCWMTACERQTHKIRKNFFRAILQQDVGWFDKQKSGELTTRLTDDLDRIREGIGDKFALCIQWIACFFSGYAIGFWKSWKLTLVLMSLSPLLALGAATMSKFIASISKREQDSYAKAGSIAEEVLSCIRTVVSFNGQKREIERYTDALLESRKLGIRKAFVSGISIGFTMFVMFGTYALGFWYGSTLVIQYNDSAHENGLSPGDVFTVFFSVIIASFSIGNAGPHIASVATAKGAAASVFETIDNKPVIDSTSTAGVRSAHIAGAIDFEKVVFSYPSRPDIQVLVNFNLHINAGQTVALVGQSGSGKSTIVNLLQRFYDPSDGSVFLDGRNLKDLNIAWLRQNIGVVSQEPVLFGYTIAENISLGTDDATQDEIVRAAQAANAHDFISELPEGYETVVGERGSLMSGGQKQRIAIARALIRDPKILLLDEATSALDSESEQIVQEALDKAREGRTTIMIAHRLSTIQNVDMIFVLENSKLVEQGNHADLMAKKSVYYQLVTLQILSTYDEQNMKDTKPFLDAININSDKSAAVFSHQHSKISYKTQTSQEPEKTEDVEEEIVPPGFCRMLRENSPEWHYITVGCITSVINGFVMPVFAVLFARVVKVYGESDEELKHKGVFWSLMFLVIGLVSFLGNMIQHVAFGQSGEKLTLRLRQKCFAAILRQDVGWFDHSQHSTGALTTRLATDASMVRGATGVRLATLMSAIFSMVAAIAISMFYGWKLCLAVLAGVPVLVVAGALQMMALKGHQKRDAELLEEAGKVASEAIEDIRTVKSLGKETFFYHTYCSHLEKPFRENLKQAHVYAPAYGFSQSVVFLFYAGAFRFGAYLVAQGEMHYDDVYQVFMAIAFTGMTVGQISSFMPDYTKASLSAGKIFKIFDTVPAIDVFSSKGIYQQKICGEIELKNVMFHYPTRPDVMVLKNFSLHIKPGQRAALVGPSGCGKSTVIALIQRYYDPSSGQVFIDGEDLKSVNIARQRSFISVVSQEPSLFNCSIRENIAYSIDGEIPLSDIIAAAIMANIHNFISSLPLGYETLVGEKGMQLSGGQKQRIAIARALICNPRILLLDEATSALDTESEKLVQTALDNAQEGRTSITIAHRLSTIQSADQIHVIQDGERIESGTHQQLLAEQGVYAALVHKQQLES